MTALPVRVVDGVVRICFSDNGTLVYQAGSGDPNSPIPTSTVDWLESPGKTAPLRAIPGRYSAPRLSPDGKRLAYSSRGSRAPTSRDIIGGLTRPRDGLTDFEAGSTDFAAAVGQEVGAPD